MKKINIKKFPIAIFGIVVLIGFISCTDLDVSFDDSVLVESSEGAFGGVNPTTFLESAYNDIEAMGGQDNTYALLEVTTDEVVVPTRGTDWGDNGVWRNLHEHTWNPGHSFVLNTWNRHNAAVFRTTQIIAPESNASPSQLAQARVLRALNMFYVMDFFGQVPFRGVNDGVNVNPRVLTRTEAFDFIIQDLTEALPGLDNGNPSTIYTVNKAFANFMLAKLYLNKEVYTGSADAGDYTKVVQAVDAITASGYDLDSDYFGLFIEDNFGSNTDIILALETWTGQRVFNQLHTNQGGWNGFATLGSLYDAFEPSDIRRGQPSLTGLGTGMLIGQQYGPINGTVVALKDRQGNPLVFTKDFPTGLAVNNERTGVRAMKYTRRNADGSPNPGNGNVIARYADALLMKAEAIMKGGTSNVTAESIIDEIRGIRGASTGGSYDMADLLDERLRELYIEGWRRNDQIRFGTFDDTWDLKTVTEEFRVLFPIPATALSTNPNLVQNPGY